MTLAGLIAALGLVIAAEGLLYAAFPGAVRRALATLSALPDPSLRTLGLVTAAVGAAMLLVAGVG
ncbi:MAG: DUF2065 domain-containing protein [Acetobacteraceae bacterium]